MKMKIIKFANSHYPLILISLFLLLQFFRNPGIGDSLIIGFLVAFQVAKMYFEFMSPKEEISTPEIDSIKEKIRFLKIQRELELSHLDLTKIANMKTGMSGPNNNQKIVF